MKPHPVQAADAEREERPFVLEPAELPLKAMRLLARQNPDGRSNAEVVRPWANSLYIIDFGSDMPIEEAALYKGPFEYVKEQVRPRRLENSRPEYNRLRG